MAKRAWSGPRRAAAALPAATAAAFKRRGFAEAAILTDWEAIVGASLAAHSCPEQLGRDGVLRLRVGGARALEIQHLEPVILDRIATYFGHRAVTRLALRQGPVPTRRRRQRQAPPPLTDAEQQSLAAMLASADDPALRNALAGLGRATLAGPRKEPS